MSFLLDTCTFLWYVSASDKLAAEIVAELRKPDTDVFLSVVSVWEASVKCQLGRLSLPEEPAAYCAAQRARHAIAALPLGEAAVAHLDKLPMLHRDPFDRMLVCQAIEHGLSIVTPDPAIRAYPVRSQWRSD